jgi:type II secretory pathway component HofQ
VSARPPRRSRARWALALALGALAAAPAGAESLVYRPQQRLASELLPLAEAALAGEGSVVADPGTNSLVLLAPRPALDRALELLAQQDRALRNVTVHYESRRVDELESEGFRVDWQVVSGNVRVGSVVLPRRESAVAVRPEAGRERESGDTVGMLRVLEGQPGRISTGVDVPVATRTLTPYGVREEGVFVQAESGFDVTPFVLGDGRVRLDFAPYEERLGPRVIGGPVVERTAAATSVTLAPGAKAAVGGLARDSTASGGSPFSGIGRARAREERVLVVWVEVE